MKNKTTESVISIGPAMNLLKEAMEEIENRVGKVETFIIWSMQEKGLNPKQIHDIMNFGKILDADLEKQ
jgi:hypothetical protein